MTLTIELSLWENQHILGAKPHRVNVDALIRRLISGLPALDLSAEATVSTNKGAPRGVSFYTALQPI